MQISTLDTAAPLSSCPSCGAALLLGQSDEIPVYRPWHLRNYAALQEYTGSLRHESREWVLALYVNRELGLLAVETLARGSIGGAEFSVGKLICRGHSLKAAGYFLVHNHPSGDPTPSQMDISVTRRLSKTSEDCDMPMLCHVIVANAGMKIVGGWERPV